MAGYLETGQVGCYDMDGAAVPCDKTGQDGEFRPGVPWPAGRFRVDKEIVFDRLTGLKWLRSANTAEFPVTWEEALHYVRRMNLRETAGRIDWRLPNRRELRSLMAYEAKKPALPAGHPFEDVFLGWYWTSTTAAINPAYAWYIHLEGARMFFGRKDQYCLFWPVSGEGKDILPQTGQKQCYDSDGKPVPCEGTGQDGELRTGAEWPEPRFVAKEEAVLDRLTNLYWLKDADVAGKTTNWDEALRRAADQVAPLPDVSMRWRLPTINELESLVDCANHTPALPAGHPFENVRDVYWSSTTSFFEPGWAWALYLNKGATGVGFKRETGFHLWPVASTIESRPGS